MQQQFLATHGDCNISSKGKKTALKIGTSTSPDLTTSMALCTTSTMVAGPLADYNGKKKERDVRELNRCDHLPPRPPAGRQ